MFNPIAVQETMVKRLKKNSNSTRTGKKVSIKIPNPNVQLTDILSEHLLLLSLVDDSIPFDAALFATAHTNMDH